jgi:hypothetical protein
MMVILKTNEAGNFSATVEGIENDGLFLNVGVDVSIQLSETRQRQECRLIGYNPDANISGHRTCLSPSVDYVWWRLTGT